MLKRREIERIIMCRPAVEAGEKLGFLPGDLQNKVDPYLRPLYDALDELLGHETVQRYIEIVQSKLHTCIYAWIERLKMRVVLLMNVRT